MRTATTFIAQVPEIAPRQWRSHYDNPSGLALTASLLRKLAQNPDPGMATPIWGLVGDTYRSPHRSAPLHPQVIAEIRARHDIEQLTPLKVGRPR